MSSRRPARLRSWHRVKRPSSRCSAARGDRRALRVPLVADTTGPRMTTTSTLCSDAELARHVQERTPRGKEAEAELCRRFGPRVRSYGLRHLRSADAAGELVQRVLLLVIEKLRGDEVREVESIASFVLSTAHHVTQAMRRGDAKMRPLSE